MKYLSLIIICLTCFSCMKNNKPVQSLNKPVQLLKTSNVENKIYWNGKKAESLPIVAKLSFLERKPLFVFITDDSCDYCVLFEKLNLNDEKVVNLLNNNFKTVTFSIKDGEKIIGSLNPGIFIFIDGIVFAKFKFFIDKKSLIQTLNQAILSANEREIEKESPKAESMPM